MSRQRKLVEQLEQWVNDTSLTQELVNMELLGNELLLHTFTIEHEEGQLVDLEGKSLSQKYGREVFNLFKVVSIGKESKLDVQINDIVSLPDELLEPIPDGSKGFTTEGQPKAGYLPLGKMIPYLFIKDKLADSHKNMLLFIIPSSWIKIKYKDAKVFTQIEE